MPMLLVVRAGDVNPCTADKEARIPSKLIFFIVGISLAWKMNTCNYNFRCFCSCINKERGESGLSGDSFGDTSILSLLLWMSVREKCLGRPKYVVKSLLNGL